MTQPTFIGLSLSLCVKDLLEKKVNSSAVLYLITNTAAETESEWERLLAIYSRTYWKHFTHAQITEEINQLRSAGLILQPRLRNTHYQHSTTNGHWLTLKQASI